MIRRAEVKDAVIRYENKITEPEILNPAALPLSKNSLAGLQPFSLKKEAYLSTSFVSISKGELLQSNLGLTQQKGPLRSRVYSYRTHQSESGKQQLHQAIDDSLYSSRTPLPVICGVRLSPSSTVSSGHSLRCTCCVCRNCPPRMALPSVNFMFSPGLSPE